MTTLTWETVDAVTKRAKGAYGHYVIRRRQRPRLFAPTWDALYVSADPLSLERVESMLATGSFNRCRAASLEHYRSRCE